MNIFQRNDSKLVNEEYTKNNYLVVNTRNKTGRTIALFSENCLYYPKNEDLFKKVVIDVNRYEWKSMAASRIIHQYYEKIIYMPEIYLNNGMY